MNNTTDRHSLAKSIFLHLLPGLLVGLCYFILAPIIKQSGFPTVLALIISGVFVLLPFELGFLLSQWKRTGEKFFGEIIRYQKPLKIWQYFLWVAIIFLLTGLAFKAFGFASEHLMQFFSWIPSTHMLDMGLSGEYSKSSLVITYVLFLPIY